MTFINKPNRYDFTKEKWYKDNIVDIFFEILIDFFNEALNNNTKIIQFNTKIKLNFKLNKEDYDFFKRTYNFNVSLNEIFPDHIKFIKEGLLEDLFKLDSLKNLAFLILLPKEKENVFYYDLILGFDNNYDIKEVVNLELNLVDANGFYEWSGIDIDEIKLRQMFNFNNFIFCDSNIEEWKSDVTEYKKITFKKICNHFYSYSLTIDNLHSELCDCFYNYWIFFCIYSCFIPKEIQEKRLKEKIKKSTLNTSNGNEQKIEKEKHTISIIDNNKNKQ